MTLERFLEERSPGWGELETLVSEARGRPERLGPDRVRRLGALYRAAAADLALARRRFRGDPVLARLEDLVGRARGLVYDAEPRSGSIRGFFSRGYWRRVRERPVALLVSALLLFGPALPASLWAVADPGAAGGLAPAEMRSAADPGPKGTDLGLTPAEEAAFSSQVLTNNIRVTFLAFAGGIAFGLMTVAVLLFNGVLLGVVGGLAAGAGNGSYFVALVAAHGVLELSCIVVAGAAGLRLGWAIVEPGHRRRVDSLVTEARATVELVLGTAPWLVVAGLIEGFVSRQGRPAGMMLAIGFAVGALYWGLVVWRGRPEGASRGLRSAPAPSP
ncbi:MAG: stage II sporulation protein M [Thermoleophilaceae bacterium]